MFSMSFCVVSGSPDMRACRGHRKSVRNTFLGFSSHKMMVPGVGCQSSSLIFHLESSNYVARDFVVCFLFVGMFFCSYLIFC